MTPCVVVFHGIPQSPSPSLPDLEVQFGRLIPEIVLKPVDLLVRQAPIHGPVRDPVALGAPARLGIGEFVDAFDLFHQIPRDASGQFEEIVLLVRFRQPERNVLEDGGVLGVRFEGCDFALLELRMESFVLGPEEADVGDLEQDHGEAFESESEGPTASLGPAGHVQDFLVYDAAPENLEPFALVHDLQFEARFREGEVILGPLLLGFAEQVVHESLQDVLEIGGDRLALGTVHPLLPPQVRGAVHLLLIEQLHALELMERGVVRRIDLVPPVHVPGA
mmetsp:Transcript_22034/g.44574  ORF Transcript_22034/g.44574 Transcript_22034/m.44574 type:complete len:278 (+) Transcript_22034:389-1222(+)